MWPAMSRRCASVQGIRPSPAWWGKRAAQHRGGIQAGGNGRPDGSQPDVSAGVGQGAAVKDRDPRPGVPSGTDRCAGIVTGAIEELPGAGRKRNSPGRPAGRSIDRFANAVLPRFGLPREVRPAGSTAGPPPNRVSSGLEIRPGVMSYGVVFQYWYFVGPCVPARARTAQPCRSVSRSVWPPPMTVVRAA